MSKPFAVTIVITHEGGTVEQSHVRGRKERISRQDFTSRALGNMLRMLSEWDDSKGFAVTGWTITEVPADSVRNIFA